MAGLLGIAELERDIFYIAGSNFTGAQGRNGMWKLDMRKFKAQDRTVSRPAASSLVTMIPSALLLNGISRLAKNDTSNLLLADSSAGTITKLNIDTKAYEIVIADPTMSSTSDGLGIGINVIRTHGDRLFFTGLDQGLFAVVPISLSTGLATGLADIIVPGTLVAADDFALSRDSGKA